MKILGLKIGWRRSGKQRRKSAPTQLERITRAALLDAANKDPKVVAALLNKYGQIQVSPEDDETEAKLEDIRARIHRKAVDTILSSRRRELEIRIDRIIDRVIGLNNGHIKLQNKEGSFEGGVGPIGTFKETGDPYRPRRNSQSADQKASWR